MKELRDIKIDLLMGNQNPIIDLFNQITEGIQIICCDVYEKHGQEFIYFANAKTAEQYHKDGEWIFYQDCKNEKFWCNYRKYWSLFESNFLLNYVEIQSITKVLVEDALKREVGTTHFDDANLIYKVEDALKREVGTPLCTAISWNYSVEEALKREVGTPFVISFMVTTTNGSITRYHNDGTLHFTETWVDGLKHGYFEYNWSDGKCGHKGHYIYGKRHGWWEDYWSDGSVKYKGYYDMGVETYSHTDIRDKLIDIALEK